MDVAEESEFCVHIHKRKEIQMPVFTELVQTIRQNYKVSTLG